MLSRRMKATFYNVAGPVMLINGLLHRKLGRHRRGPVKVHLGPGRKNYLPGWVNVDANMITAKVDVWADLRNALPFPSGSVDCFYSHHVIEHLPDLAFHFAEMHRCLKPGGVLRVGGPNGDSAIDRFVAGDTAWFSDFPDKRTSLGGRFENFIFCRGEHLTILTSSYLSELVVNAGLELLGVCAPTQETHSPEHFGPDVMANEHESDWDHPHTLIIEARKPR